MNDAAWMSQPMLEGPYETGCHTHQGNDLVLYCQTTQHLHQRRENIFRNLYGKYPNDFVKAAECMHDPMKELFRVTTQSYRREVKEDPGVDVQTFSDFYNDGIREYARWCGEASCAFQ